MALSPRQEVILTWLRRAYPEAADLFVSGLSVLKETTLPCRIRLTAHAFREICIAINSQHSERPERIEPFLDKMINEYRKVGYEPIPLNQSEEPMASDSDSIFVSAAFMRSVADVVDAHTLKKSARERTRIAFNAMASTSGLQVEITPTADRWHNMYNYLVARTHDPRADTGGTDVEQFNQEVGFFEETLESLALSAIANLDVLDGILESANS